MSELLKVNPNIESSKSSEDKMNVAPNSEAWNFVSKHLARRVPLFVSRDQAYYWTREWQEGEAEADEEIRRGELRRFSDIDEAMRWLDSPED